MDSTPTLPVGEAYAIGAVRFDSDYLAQRTVPLYSLQRVDREGRDNTEVIADGGATAVQVTALAPPASTTTHGVDKAESATASCDVYVPAHVTASVSDTRTRVEPESFVGSVVTSAPGSYESGDWRTNRYFRRHEKASRMELERLFATPLPHEASYSLDDVARVKEPPEYYAEYTALNDGAICGYTYLGSSETIAPHFNPVALRELAFIIASLLAGARDGRAAVAAAVLNARLRSATLTDVNTFNVIRDCVIEMFDADGCSIFAWDPGDKLVCVSSSGLSEYQEDVMTSKAEYNSEVDDVTPLSPHWTVRVALGNPRRVRINNRILTTEQRKPGIRRLLESFVLSPIEHRRTLLQSIPNPSAHGGHEPPRGVIRVVRSTQKRPFTPADAELLEAIASLIRDAFAFRAEWRVSKTLPKGTLKLEEWYETKLSDANAGEPGIRRPGKAFERACERLYFYAEGYACWSRRRVEGVLQDLFAVFDLEMPVLAMLRIVARSPEGLGVLPISYFHGYRNVQVAEDGPGKPLRIDEGGIGWESILRRRAIEFSKEDRGYTRLFDSPEWNIELGICLPVVLPFRTSPTIGALSIEMAANQPAAYENERIRFVFAAAKQIARCACEADALLHHKSVRRLSMAASVAKQRDKVSITATFLGILSGFMTMETDVEGRRDRVDGSENTETWAYMARINEYRGRPRRAVKSDQKRAWDKRRGEIQSEWSKPIAKKLAATLREDDAYLPRRQLAHIANRQAVGHSADSQDGNAFHNWRVSPELEAKLFGLEMIGVRMDVCRGRWLLPLWFGCGIAGELVGIRMPADEGVDGTADTAHPANGAIAMRLCDTLTECLWIWSRFAWSLENEGEDAQRYKGRRWIMLLTDQENRLNLSAKRTGTEYSVTAAVGAIGIGIKCLLKGLGERDTTRKRPR